MTPSPAPGLLSDWISLGAYWWLVTGAIVVTVLAIVIVNLVRVWEEDDAANEDAQQQAIPYRCAGHGCQLRTFYSDEGGTTWVCATCEQSYWVPVADVPFNQESA